MIYSERYGLWYPDFEVKGDILLRHVVMRVSDCDVAARYVKTKTIAVQAGGHTGLWARRLSKMFEFVYTFEPVPELFECMRKNTGDRQEIIARQAALGPTSGTCKFAKRSGGRGKIHEDGDAEVQMIAIDDLELPRCDLMYLDIEHGEIPALEGAAKTIEAHSPVLALEVHLDQEQKVRAWARANRYEPIEKVHNDWILTRKVKGAK